MFFLSIVTLSCSLIKPDSSDRSILFDIDGTPVHSEEFLYNFGKNLYNSDTVITRDDIDEYLDLYINFKLKVKEATVQGLDTTQSFITEFTKYKDQLTESYLKNDSIIIELVKEAYDRMKYEVNVSHIIIRIPNQNDHNDTLSAFDKINGIYEKLDSGAVFQELAIAWSEDPSVKMNHGNLGYFTALQMVYPFESMAYTTPVNQHSVPFRTRFGYHILKVNDIRPARGKVQVAHIMLRFPSNPTSKDSVVVKNTIFQIYDSLINGGVWEALCRQYSEDANTKNNGGILQPFETGRVIPAFSEAAFRLNESGEISEPVLTPYGWHIIRLIKKDPLESFLEIKDELTERVRRDSRSELAHTFLIDKLKKENNFQMNEMVREACFQIADSTLFSNNWPLGTTEKLMNEPLFTLQGKDYPAIDFLNYARLKTNDRAQKFPDADMGELMNGYIEEKLIEFEKEHLAEKYYDYKMLVKEYREGILLFDLMDKKVWNKAVEDTLGLEAYFNQHVEEYNWEERLDAMIFRTSSAEEIEVVHNLLDHPFYVVSEDTIQNILSNDGQLDGESLSRIDSLFNLILQDTSLYVEVACNPKNMEVMIKFLKENNRMNKKVFFSDIEEDALYLRVVTSSKKSLEETINKNSALTLQVESGLYQKGDHEIIDLIEWKPGIYDLSIEDQDYLVYVERIIPSANKDLIEVRGQVISDYQNFLEKEWIEELKSKYSVNINNDALSKIYKQFGVK